MKTLVAALLLAASVTAVQAKEPKYVGAWCLELSVRNGHDTRTGAFIPPTNLYKRGSDCSADKQITLKARSLRGLKWRIDQDELKVEGGTD